ncbi:MAG TPA: carboxymuconolactone decarboxylase family protein [Gemmatimonadaceae bacterium]|nr:carboxymuconolactone decarboxylase family protein [Gemmatimonadaceae bacterium]
MSSSTPSRATVPGLNDEVRALVRLAGAIAGASPQAVRHALEEAATKVRPIWAEEAILQSYLFAGFPRALNAMRDWRRISGRAAPPSEPPDDQVSLTHRGEETCRAVYGSHYEKLRENIRGLHPALDGWMINEGYGKVLSRGALDLLLRELCIVAACAVTGQERQLRSHLLGARNVGASAEQIEATLDAIADLMDGSGLHAAKDLWLRLQSVASD